MISILTATEDHIDQILNIEQEAISPPWTHGLLLSEIYNVESYFVVAAQTSLLSTSQEATQIKGFIILRCTHFDAELLQIAVAINARSCGVGDMLMRAMLDHANEKTLDKLFLEVRKSNEPAITLYKKHGFKTLSHRKDYYTTPTEDAIIMEKILKIL